MAVQAMNLAFDYAQYGFRDEATVGRIGAEQLFYLVGSDSCWSLDCLMSNTFLPSNHWAWIAYALHNAKSIPAYSLRSVLVAVMSTRGVAFER